MRENEILLKEIIITAVFAALTYVGTTINIPLPTGGKIHLGNFVCILTGLIFGGFIGGVSGSLGMTFYNVVEGSPVSTIIRIMIVKFLLGFVVGVLFKFLVKKEIKVNKVFLGVGSFLLGLFILFILLKIFDLNKIGSKTFEIRALLLVSLFMLSASLIVLGLFKFKNNLIAVAVLTASIGVMVNTAGEFFFRIPLIMFFDSVGKDEAIITSILRLPSNFLTGIITIFFIAGIFYPVYIASKTILLDEMNIDEGEIDE